MKTIPHALSVTWYHKWHRLFCLIPIGSDSRDPVETQPWWSRSLSDLSVRKGRVCSFSVMWTINFFIFFGGGWCISKCEVVSCLKHPWIVYRSAYLKINAYFSTAGGIVSGAAALEQTGSSAKRWTGYHVSYGVTLSRSTRGNWKHAFT